MKKTIFVAVLCFIGLSQSNAQFSFKPGLRGGVNFSHFSQGDRNSYDLLGNPGSTSYDSKTDFYLGFYGALHLTKYYTLQPEIDYSRQGSNYKLNNDSFNYRAAYLSIAVINKFTFNDKFNIHLGPTIDFMVEKNFNPASEVDLAFVLGAGYSFTKNFGIEARVKKGIVPILDYSNTNHTNVVFSFGATYTFDLK